MLKMKFLPIMSLQCAWHLFGVLSRSSNSRLCEESWQGGARFLFELCRTMMAPLDYSRYFIRPK